MRYSKYRIPRRLKLLPSMNFEIKAAFNKSTERRLIALAEPSHHNYLYKVNKSRATKTPQTGSSLHNS